MTQITKITVSGNTVWMTYNRRGNVYKGFTPFKKVEDAIAYAKATLTKWDENFMCVTTSFELI